MQPACQVPTDLWGTAWERPLFHSKSWAVNPRAGRPNFPAAEWPASISAWNRKLAASGFASLGHITQGGFLPQTFPGPCRMKTAAGWWGCWEMFGARVEAIFSSEM